MNFASVTDRRFYRAKTRFYRSLRNSSGRGAAPRAGALYERAAVFFFPPRGVLTLIGILEAVKSSLPYTSVRSRRPGRATILSRGVKAVRISGLAKHVPPLVRNPRSSPSPGSHSLHCSSLFLRLRNLYSIVTVIRHGQVSRTFSIVYRPEDNKKKVQDCSDAFEAGPDGDAAVTPELFAFFVPAIVDKRPANERDQERCCNAFTPRKSEDEVSRYTMGASPTYRGF